MFKHTSTQGTMAKTRKKNMAKISLLVSNCFAFSLNSMSTRKNAILSWKETLVTLKAQREGQLDNRSRWAVSQCVKSYELHVHKEESHLFVRSRIEAAPLLDWLNWYECTKTLHWGAWKQTAENAFGAFPDITLIVITQPAPAVKTRESSILQNWLYYFWKQQNLTHSY